MPICIPWSSQHLQITAPLPRGLNAWAQIHSGAHKTHPELNWNWVFLKPLCLLGL